MLVKIYNDIVNFLSFADNLRKLRAKINISIDIPEIITEFPDSHPRGFIKEFRKRRTTIVETYLKISKSLESASYNQRIQALSLLAEHIIYSRSLKMPLNAARVQLALMKEVVKNRDNKRVQLELMRDFTVSSFGHPRAIRKYLKKLDIIEVPETGKELKDLKMGWDFHVHDSTSYGRKQPIQLIIDAFIKGISELTIVHNNLDREESVKEVLEAGRILGIKVNIALEFSALSRGKRFHYMYILPDFSNKKGRFKKFLKQKNDDFKEFLHELEENEKKRQKNIETLIGNFNKTYLPAINAGFEKGTMYYLEPITSKEAEGIFGHKIFSRRQLGEFLFPKLKKIIENRALQITALKIQCEKNPEKFTKNEVETILNRFKFIRDQYSNLEPEKIRMEYFAGNDAVMAETTVSSLEGIYLLAKKSDGLIKFIQPLEHGLQAAIDEIFDHYKMLSITEVYNMYDSIDTKESDFVKFTIFIKLLNQGDSRKVEKFLESNKLDYNKKKLARAIEYIHTATLIPAIGSDAAGRSTLAPGMGFVLENRLVKHQRKMFARNHYNLPKEISELVYKLAKIPKMPLKKGEKPQIICLGIQSGGKKNMLGDEKIEKPIGLFKAWEYLNPAIKNFIFILIGFIPAYFTVGIEYAILWFAITGSRNMFVDVVSGNGFSPKEWRTTDIDWSNLAQSLFWTGFSVPILGFVKANFDNIYTGSHEGPLYEALKFFFINISNGAYLASHNYIRGFDRATIQGNFFRSILAWPLAASFSPIGNTLGIPSIVQAKFWSDFVASIIEGRGKYVNILRVKDQIMCKLIPDLVCEDEDSEKLAMLDMIYFIKESNRAKTALKKQFIPKSGIVNKIKLLFKHKKTPTSISEVYYEIQKRINTPGMFDGLIDFIIRNYNREQSIYLIKLVSSDYHKVLEYFNSINKR
jgi:hypothetical protein